MTTAITHSKRPWFRFSLRTSLVVMTFLAVLLGMYVKPFRDRKAAALAIERLGGVINGGTVGPKWLQQLVGDDGYFVEAHSVAFGGLVPHRLTDGELEALMPHLANLPQLTRLSFWDSSVTDDGVKLLFPLSGKLQVLDLRNSSDVSPAGFAVVQKALPKCDVRHHRYVSL